jgi:hypothetical protein
LRDPATDQPTSFVHQFGQAVGFISEIGDRFKIMGIVSPFQTIIQSTIYIDDPVDLNHGGDIQGRSRSSCPNCQ